MVNEPFRALSNPIRRGIVERLAAGPATVGEATGGFGVSKPAISKHLKVLEETGVVRRVVEGRTHRLWLEPDVLGEAADWMDRQRALWGRLFDVVDDYLRRRGPDEHAADRVTAGVGGRPPGAAGQGEGAHPRPHALAAERHRMPSTAVERDYRFDGPDGPMTCSTCSKGAGS